ncbi:MAG: type II toxin-antitoxin system mRNA interferase toxin, RelE/StbE family [bacterium]|nr:type II toxin-antitoxin system mRNA interferase toxin, RelE/StbE family [bacterium]
MSDWQIKINKSSKKYLDKLESKKRENLLVHIRELINWVENKPLTIPVNISALKGQWEGNYRLRAGDLRVIFKIEADEILIKIIHIGPRGDVYR